VDADEYSLPSSTNTVVARVSAVDVTTKTVDGTGTFDTFAAGIAAHLLNEYVANRITGAEYTKAFTTLMESALVQATQFALNKEQVYWQSQLVQAQAINARVALMTAKIQLAQAEMEAKNAAANFALTKSKIRESELTACISQYNLETLLPKQTTLLHSQIGKTNAEIGISLEERLRVIEQTELTTSQRMEVESQTAINEQQRLQIIAQTAFLQNQAEKIDAEIAMIEEQINTQRGSTMGTRTDGTPITGLVGKQIERLSKEILLVQEQAETQRANTLGTRTDGATITGSVGKQIALHQAQIESFARDNETKLAKLMVEMWITQKTIDEGLLAPSAFDNTSMNTLMAALRDNVNI
jgi:hypothetical protein